MLMLSMAIMQGISLKQSEITPPVADFNINMRMTASSSFHGITYENFSPQTQETCKLHVSFTLTEAFKGNFVYAMYTPNNDPEHTDYQKEQVMHGLNDFYEKILPTSCWTPGICGGDKQHGCDDEPFPGPVHVPEVQSKHDVLYVGYPRALLPAPQSRSGHLLYLTDRTATAACVYATGSGV